MSTRFVAERVHPKAPSGERPLQDASFRPEREIPKVPDRPRIVEIDVQGHEESWGRQPDTRPGLSLQLNHGHAAGGVNLGLVTFRIVACSQRPATTEMPTSASNLFVAFPRIALASSRRSSNAALGTSVEVAIPRTSFQRRADRQPASQRMNQGRSRVVRNQGFADAHPVLRRTG